MAKQLAATNFNIQDNFSPAGLFPDTTSIGQIFTLIIQILLAVAAILAIIFIITAGLQIVTSGGDEKKLAAAQSRLTFALIGLGVSALAFVIISFVERFVGL